MSSVRDFIDHIDQDNNLDAQNVFNSELQTRIQQSLNNKREEVANSLINTNHNKEEVKD
tara:strand:+ start:64 stop:240 length:177 start_codon:yes stop_codon:yes gene_type:complete